MARRNPSNPRELGLFSVPFFLCPLGRMGTHFWRTFGLFCGGRQPPPANPFSKPPIKAILASKVAKLLVWEINQHQGNSEKWSGRAGLTGGELKGRYSHVLASALCLRAVGPATVLSHKCDIPTLLKNDQITHLAVIRLPRKCRYPCLLSPCLNLPGQERDQNVFGGRCAVGVLHRCEIVVLTWSPHTHFALSPEHF